MQWLISLLLLTSILPLIHPKPRWSCHEYRPEKNLNPKKTSCNPSKLSWLNLEKYSILTSGNFIKKQCNKPNIKTVISRHSSNHLKLEVNKNVKILETAHEKMTNSKKYQIYCLKTKLLILVFFIWKSIARQIKRFLLWITLLLWDMIKSLYLWLWMHSKVNRGRPQEKIIKMARNTLKASHQSEIQTVVHNNKTFKTKLSGYNRNSKYCNLPRHRLRLNSKIQA